VPESIGETHPAQPIEAPEAAPATILLVGDGILVATAGNYIVLINGGDLGERGVKAVRQAFETKTPQAKVGYFVVLEPEIKPMLPSEVRSQLAEILASFEQHIGGVAVTYEGTGFKATGIRSIATAIQLASRTSIPHKTFSALAEAIGWLTGAMPSGTVPNASELERILEGLRARARRP
jgi:hypothetical protein